MRNPVSSVYIVIFISISVLLPCVFPVVAVIPPFCHQVSVEGEPLGALGTLAVEFEWPFEVTSGKWLLYLTEIVTKGTTETHCVPPGDIINLLNLTVSYQSLSEALYRPPNYIVSLWPTGTNVLQKYDSSRTPQSLFTPTVNQ